MKTKLKIVGGIFAAWLALGWVAFGQLSFVNSAQGYISGGSGTAGPLTVTAGNLLVVFCRTGGGNNTLAVTDTLGNTFSASTHQNDGNVGNTQMFATVASSSGSDTFTCTNTTGSGGVMIVLQYAGAGISASYIYNTNAATSSGGWTSPTFSTTAPNAVVIQCLGGDNGNPYTAGNIGSTAGTIRESDTVQSAACQDVIFGTVQTGITANLNHGGDWNGQLAVFQGSGAAPPPTAAAPTFSPAGGRVAAGTTVTITCSTSGSSPFYTTDGSTPTPSSTPGSSVTVNVSGPLKAICSGTGLTDSSVSPTSYQVGALTWYVRHDGGTRYDANNTSGQCDGLHDAAYPGTGTNQPCAFGDLRWLYDDQHTYGAYNWALAGGDTAIIDTGQWKVGWDDPSSSAWCSGQSGSQDCFMPPPPAGSSGNHTRLLGRNYAACSLTKTVSSPVGGTPLTIFQPDLTKTSQIYPASRVGALFSLRDTQYVDVECLEFTSHNTNHCIEHGVTRTGGQPPETPACTNTDQIADSGVLMNGNTANLLIQDIAVHGTANSGIRGPFGANIVGHRIETGLNNGPGWNMSPSTGSSANGAGASLTLDNYLTDWNGFVEQYPHVDPIPVIIGFTQSTQSFDADGISSQAGGQFSFYCNHCFSVYNTEDAFDMGHIEALGTTNTVQITNSVAFGNMAGTIKYGGAATTVNIFNNLILDNCYRMATPMTGAPSTYNEYLQDICRAGDNTGGYTNDGQDPSVNTITYRHNTILSQIDNFFDFGCNTTTGTGYDVACSPSQWFIQDNLFIGLSDSNCTHAGVPCDFGGNSMPGAYIFVYSQGCCSEIFERTGDPAYGTMTRDHNLYYNLRNLGTLGTGEVVANPLFTNQPTLVNYTDEMPFDNFNFLPSDSSPAKNAGVVLSGQTTDYFGSSWASVPSLGAVEFAGSTPPAATPTCSPAGGTYSSAQTVTCSSTTTGSTTYCTVDGSAPTVDSPVCTGISVATSLTLKAIAYASGYSASAVDTEDYTITVPPPSGPTVQTGGTLTIGGTVVVQ